jgi:hypothetical protein
MSDLELSSDPELEGELELRGLLRDVTMQQPPHQVDITLARVTGARTVRRRRIVTGAVSALVVLAGAAGAVVAVPAVMSHGPVVSVSTALIPLHLHMSPGWLPPGLDQYEQADLTANIQTLTYLERGLYGGLAPAAQLTIKLHSGQVQSALPRHQSPSDPTYTPGPLIGGLPSVWSGDDELDWYWAPGAVATIWADGAFDASTEDVAIHVARMLRTDVEIPMSMPFTVTAPADPSEHLTEAIIEWNNGVWNMCRLSFDDRTNTPVIGYSLFRGSFRYVEVYNNPGATPVPQLVSGSEARAQVGGYPAFVDTGPGGATILLVGYHGTQVLSGVYEPLSAYQKAVGLALSVEVAANPADPSTWPALPIR